MICIDGVYGDSECLHRYCIKFARQCISIEITPVVRCAMQQHRCQSERFLQWVSNYYFELHLASRSCHHSQSTQGTYLHFP